jgi:BON domain
MMRACTGKDLFLTSARLAFGTSLLLSAVVLEGCGLSPQAGRPDDKAIVSNIDARFFQDPVLKRRAIRVDSQRGVVTLQGSVNTDLEKAAVERIASREVGVKKVVDQLGVIVPEAVHRRRPTRPRHTSAAGADPESEPISRLERRAQRWIESCPPKP